MSYKYNNYAEYDIDFKYKYSDLEHKNIYYIDNKNNKEKSLYRLLYIVFEKFKYAIVHKKWKTYKYNLGQKREKEFDLNKF